MADESSAACVCGWPEKDCLRRVLGNGPPFPPEPCELKVERLGFVAAQEDAIRQAYLRGVSDGFQQGAIAAAKAEADCG
jgi:hypothetical protein